MPFGDDRSWVLPWRRVQPIPCEEIGDTTAGATSNIKTIVDNVRRYRGNVADTTALGNLTGNINGDIVLLLNNGSGVTEWRRFNSTGSTWDVVGGGAGAGVATFNTRAGAVTLTNTDVNGTISATDAGSTPTSYFGTTASDCVFVAASNGLVLNSNEHIIANIDSTAGGTSAEFRVNINGQSATGGTNVFKVTEAGNVTATGSITCTSLLPSADIALVTTSAGSVPSSFIGTANTDCFFVATSNGSVINGSEHVIVNIDSNNSGTAGEFRVNINSNTGTGGTNVFKVTEAGNLTTTGTVTATDLLPSGSVTLGSTTAGNSPTSFVGTTNQNGLYVDATAGTVINSQNSVKILIDADNNSTGQTFKVTTNSGNTTGGTDLLVVDESGNTSITGNLTITGALGRTVVVHTSGASYNLTSGTDVLIINKGTGSATTVNLPASPATGLTYVIKDGKGDAHTNNITIDPAGATTIDGEATFVLNGNYVAVSVVYNGTEWNVY